MIPLVPLDEAAMQSAEARIPELAVQAVRQARQQALKTSGKVVETFNGQLVETFADGHRRVLRDLPPPIPVQPGTVLKRRWA
jgi:hypothetical protein